MCGLAGKEHGKPRQLEIRLLNEICAPIGGGRESQTFQGYPHAGDVLIRATVLLECGEKGGLHLMCHVETMEGMSNSLRWAHGA